MCSLIMKEKPVFERPYEKLEINGAKSLTNAELLAIVLKTGTRDETALDIAQRLLVECVGEDAGFTFANVSLEELKTIKGIGRVKAITLKAVFELACRFNANENDKKFLGATSLLSQFVMSKLANEKQEKFMVIGLDTKCRLVRSDIIAIGNLNLLNLSAREVFRMPIECGCEYLALAHNHPSGDPEPSQEDIQSTLKLIEMSRWLEIKLIDHIIVGNGKYVSFKKSKLF